MKEHIIAVDERGNLSFIYDDRLRGLLDVGEASIRRASAVEPGDFMKGQDPLRWYSDMASVQGPVLGGFSTREAALAAEVEWIKSNVLTREAT